MGAALYADIEDKMGKRFRYSEGYRIDGFVVGNENELGSEDDDKESEESDSGVHTSKFGSLLIYPVALSDQRD